MSSIFVSADTPGGVEISTSGTIRDFESSYSLIDQFNLNGYAARPVTLLDFQPSEDLGSLVFSALYNL